MKQKRRLIGPVVLLASLLAGGCNAVPGSYSQWQADQAERERFAAAGVPYKSRAELKQEAAEMRRVAEKTSFAPAGK